MVRLLLSFVSSATFQEREPPTENRGDKHARKNKVHIGFQAFLSVLFIIALVEGITQILEMALRDVEECVNNTGYKLIMA